jgi:hypothetical protein
VLFNTKLNMTAVTRNLLDSFSFPWDIPLTFFKHKSTLKVTLYWIISLERQNKLSLMLDGIHVLDIENVCSFSIHLYVII